MVNDSIIFFPWNCLFTVWKSKNFSSVWILREINSADEKTRQIRITQVRKIPWNWMQKQWRRKSVRFFLPLNSDLTWNHFLSYMNHVTFTKCLQKSIFRDFYKVRYWQICLRRLIWRNIFTIFPIALLRPDFTWN